MLAVLGTDYWMKMNCWVFRREKMRSSMLVRPESEALSQASFSRALGLRERTVM